MKDEPQVKQIYNTINCTALVFVKSTALLLFFFWNDFSLPGCENLRSLIFRAFLALRKFTYLQKMVS